MNLYLDTEFNGHGGELISMALAADDGQHWYQVMPEPRIWNEWCYENVFPHLGQPPVDPDFFRASLRAYLEARPGCRIYADWPGDFGHLIALMCGPKYETSWSIPCEMVLLRGTEPEPEIPHNALSDSVALMRWHQSQ